MVCVMGMKNIFMRWQKDDTVYISICCVGWWIQKIFKKGEDKTIYYTNNRIERKKTDRLLPSNLVLTTALKTQYLRNHILIQECIILCFGCQGSPPSYVPSAPSTCTSAAVCGSLCLRRVWTQTQPGSLWKQLFCFTVVYQSTMDLSFIILRTVHNHHHVTLW